MSFQTCFAAQACDDVPRRVRHLRSVEHRIALAVLCALVPLVTSDASQRVSGGRPLFVPPREQLHKHASAVLPPVVQLPSLSVVCASVLVLVVSHLRAPP